MADLVFSIAKGRVGAYVQNVESGSPADSRLIVVLLEASGIEPDEMLRDYDTLAEILAASNTEQATMGRKTIAAAAITLSVDDTNDRLDIDIDDLVWIGAMGNAVSALIICYIPDGVAPGADSTAIPLTKHDFVVTPDGSDITAVIAAAEQIIAPGGRAALARFPCACSPTRDRSGRIGVVIGRIYRR